MAKTVKLSRTNDPDIDGLLSGFKWAGPFVTYSFPGGLTSTSARTGISQVSGEEARAVSNILEHEVEGFTNLHFGESRRNADIEIAQGNRSFVGRTVPTFYPADWISNLLGLDRSIVAVRVLFPPHARNPLPGDYDYLTILHELGHALGLKHGHASGGVANEALPPEHDSLEFTVMTYRSFVGGPTKGGYTNGPWDYPQSYMMLDIAAMQTMYGANYEQNAGDTRYTWSPTTGAFSIDGHVQSQAGDGLGGAANRVFMTIWDGGGNDTYDFRAYKTPVDVDLNPGSWSVTSTEQLANLGPGQQARGNVFNALLHNDNPLSLIENAIGGANDDVIVGNRAVNSLDGRAGNDTLFGDARTMSDNAVGSGDTLFGGGENDILVGDAPIMSGTTIGGNDLLLGGDNNDNLMGDAGTMLNNAQGGADRLDGGADNDTLFGDALVALRDFAVGGPDTFVFIGNDFGNDTVGDFRQGEDHLEFQVPGITDIGDLTIVPVDGDTVIFAGVSGTVTLSGFNGTLAADDFQFLVR